MNILQAVGLLQLLAVPTFAVSVFAVFVTCGMQHLGGYLWLNVPASVLVFLAYCWCVLVVCDGLFVSTVSQTLKE